MIQPVKTAVIGCGMISDPYLDTMINKFNILDVVGCHDRNPEKEQGKARQYGIETLTMEQILEDESIEIVVNLTQPTSHYPLIKQLLEAGKHVYTEKALTVELDQAAELVKFADEKKLYLGAAPDTFLGASVQTARYVVDSGMIGDVTSCSCALWRDSSIFGRPNSFTVKPGGGIGFDVGIYYITALLSILGPVREVSGIVKTRNPIRKANTINDFGETYQIENENILAGTIHFDQGAVGTLLFDSNSVFVIPERPSFVLYGTMGVMYMADPNLFGGQVRLILKGNNEPFTMQQSHGFSDECRGLGAAEMAWSMRLGRKHRASKEMAYHALETLHGIVKSGETKSSQIVKSTFEIPTPLPRGYVGNDFQKHIEENGIAQLQDYLED